jgi:hypothetical protein
LIVADLRRSAEHDRNAPKGIFDKHVVMALQAEGFSNHNHHRVDIEGDRRQLWVRDRSGPLSKLSGDQIRERYLLETQQAEHGGGRMIASGQNRTCDPQRDVRCGSAAG